MSTQTVLIIDDDPAVTSVVPAVLRSDSVEVVAVGTAGDALRLLEEHPWDLVLCDLRLGTGGAAAGLEVLSRARGLQPGARIVLWTAHASRAIEDEARKRGADACWSKSNTGQRLCESVRQLLSGAEERS